MRRAVKYNIPIDFYVIISICALFAFVAFISDAPVPLLKNFVKLNLSRSVLISDYVEIAGVGAALLNSALSTLMFMFLLIFGRQKANGPTIAALFLTLAFSLFGKNLFNTIPLCLGVYIYSKITRIKFSSLLTVAMYSATVCPIVSEVAFINGDISFLTFLLAYGTGIIIGIIFPIVANSLKSHYGHYCLYTSGIAGGFIATFLAGLMKSFGIWIEPENYWYEQNSIELICIAFIMAAALIIFGLVTDKPKTAISNFKKTLTDHDVYNNDFLDRYGYSCYINIGVMLIFATSLMLIMGVPINGPVFGGILTIAGFAAAGKHILNTIPVIAGSIAAAFFNDVPFNDFLIVLPILFSTGLAPISSRYGWGFGVLAGFLHVSVAMFIGDINGGMNLYNNGFAGGFVVFTFVPIIAFFKKEHKRRRMRKHK